jgi:antitoxin (DNA-binding transcriptional repressor) of toxin-antitoxin stability system
MKDVNVTRLRQNLPAFLALVQQGAHFRVTVHGKVIAELAPPRASNQQVDDARELLRGSVRRYERPLEPALEPEDWHVNR